MLNIVVNEVVDEMLLLAIVILLIFNITKFSKPLS